MNCAHCGSDGTVEITAFGDVHARVICRDCGKASQEVPFRQAPHLGPVHSCAVPTPEDILRSAGVAVI